MAWWSPLRGTVDRLLGRAPAVATRTAPEAPRSTSPPRSVQAWSAMPPLQRVLAAPLGPVAPLAAFTSSLSAFQNPSFLGSLGHDVDPAAGGLVNGLADLAPTAPGVRAPAGSLPVPAAAARATPRPVQRILSGWPTAEAVRLEPPLDHVDPVDPAEPTGAATPATEWTAAGPADAPAAEPPEDTEANPPDLPGAGESAASGTDPAPTPASPVPAAEAGGQDTAHPSSPPAVQRAVGEAPLPQVGPRAEVPAPLGEPAPLPLQRSAVAPPNDPGLGVPAPSAPAPSLRTPPAPAAESLAAPAPAPAHQSLPVQRTLPVVPDVPPRAARLPESSTRELPVSRLVDSPAPLPAPTTEVSPVEPDLPDRPSTPTSTSEGTPPVETPDPDAVRAPAPAPAPEADRDDLPDEEPVGDLVVTAPGPGTPSSLPVTALAPVPHRPDGAQPLPLQRSTGRLGDPPAQTSSGDVSPPVGPSGPQPAAAPPTRLASEQPGHLPVPTVPLQRSAALLPELPVLTAGPASNPSGPLSPASALRSPYPAATEPRTTAEPTTVQRLASAPPPSAPSAPLLGDQEPLLPAAGPDTRTTPEPVQRLTFLPAAEELAQPLTPLTTGGSVTAPPRSTPVPPPPTGPDHPLWSTATAPVQRQDAAAPPASGRPDAPTITVDASPQRLTAPVSALRFPPPPVQRVPAPGQPVAPPRASVAQDSAGQPGRFDPEPAQVPAEPKTTTTEEPGYRVVPIGPPGGSAPAGVEPEGLAALALSPFAASVQRLEVAETGPPTAPHVAGPTVSAASPRSMPPTRIVQRQTLPVSTPAQPLAPQPPTTAPAVSFVSMFSGVVAGPDEVGALEVQRDVADVPPPPSPEPAPAEPEGTSGAVAAAPPPPAAAAPPAAADLDEMARRLFEPLSARLRAELWLDRERAGLMTDIRP